MPHEGEEVREAGRHLRGTGGFARGINGASSTNNDVAVAEPTVLKMIVLVESDTLEE